MPRPKVVLNSPGMRELLTSDGVRAHLTELMGGVEAAAKASAPLDTGEYQASIHIEQDTTDRVAVRVVADSDHALAVEARTGNLARALDAIGGEVDPGKVRVKYTTKAGKTIWATQAQVDNWTRGSRK